MPFSDASVHYLGQAVAAVIADTFEHATYRLEDEVLMVTAQQTAVYVDLDERRAQPVPEAYRQAIIAFEGDDVER